MLSLSSTARRLVVTALVSASLATSLAGCASTSSGDTSASREASLYRASRICVVNESGVALYNVSEVELTRTGPSHPDAAGPLAPGATWCTNGYNSFTDENDRNVDATVGIQFTESPNDRSMFKVANPAMDFPWMTVGHIEWENSMWTPGACSICTWEQDLLLPRDRNVLDVPHHPVHLRRADDSSDFIEWIVTVRS